MQTVQGLLNALVERSSCSALDWPHGSSHAYLEPPSPLSEPACTAYGFAVGWQCGLSLLRPEEQLTAGHLGLLVGAVEEQGM